MKHGVSQVSSSVKAFIPLGFKTIEKPFETWSLNSVETYLLLVETIFMKLSLSHIETQVSIWYVYIYMQLLKPMNIYL